MKIRYARHEDGQFILEFLVRNALRHFNVMYRDPKYQEGLVRQIKQTIDRGICPMPEKEYPSELWVSEINGVAIGFMWILHRSETESEIYLVGTDSKFRGKGCAESLLQHVISKLNNGHSVTSRVKRRSKGMKALLSKLGFSGKFYLPFRPQHFNYQTS